MADDLKRIEYRSGLVESGKEPHDLPLKTWCGADIPAEIAEAVRKERLLELGGAHGHKGVGDPPQYDYVKLASATGEVEIEVFNRAITLFMTDDENVRRIHRVLCKLDEEADKQDEV
jgi:hypothetical protein